MQRSNACAAYVENVDVEGQTATPETDSGSCEHSLQPQIGAITNYHKRSRHTGSDLMRCYLIRYRTPRGDNPIMTFKKLALAGLISAVLTAPAFAGPQFIDKSGFAVSGYDVVAYWGLKQAPVGQEQPKGVPGKKSITADYNGAKWAFSSTANRDAFLKNPAKYAPAYDGHCAYGAAQGGKVPTNPNLWRIVDNKLYLNITKNVVGFWEKDVPGHIVTADKNWPGLEPKDSPNRNAPNWDASNAPVTQ